MTKNKLKKKPVDLAIPARKSGICISKETAEVLAGLNDLLEYEFGHDNYAFNVTAWLSNEATHGEVICSGGFAEDMVTPQFDLFDHLALHPDRVEILRNLIDDFDEIIKIQSKSATKTTKVQAPAKKKKKPAPPTKKRVVAR